MTRAGKGWSATAILFVVVTAALGAAVARYTNWVLDRVEKHGFGYVADPEGTRQFLSELDKPLFSQAGQECLENAKPVDTFLWRYADDCHREVYGTPFKAWNQGPHGSCVSFGWALGSYISQCVDHKTGKLPDPPRLVATEPIYGGSRTAGRLPPVTFAGFSEGSYGAAAARWVSGLKNGTGGILYRQRYAEADLSVYSIPLSKQWGAYGVPAALAKVANDHKAQAVALVTTWDELVAAISSGYCVPVCSNVGFAATRTRDKDGFLPRGGTWNHCMLIGGIRFADGLGKRDGALVINSWGTDWCDGPKWPSDQPDGSFWASKADIESMLRQGDSFAIGGVDGFKYRDLEHREWLTPAVDSLTRMER